MGESTDDQRVDGPAYPGIDTSIAHPARIYDYLIGGKDNYAVDRAVADRLVVAMPHVKRLARRNRAFVLRAVRYPVGELGIDQIVDVGTGIPTSPAVHEVAKQINPDVRVAYVLLEDEPGVVTSMG